MLTALTTSAHTWSLRLSKEQSNHGEVHTQQRLDRTTDGMETPPVAETMVESFPDLAVNLIYTVLCLVPGFISLQTATYAADLDADMGEFEKSTWSLVGSGVSLSALYFLYVSWMGIVTGRFELVRSLDIGWVELVAVYPLLLFVAVLLGYVSAKVLRRTSRRPRLSGFSWE